MLIGIKQNDRRLCRDLQEVGCLFLCMAESSPLEFNEDVGCECLNWIWRKACRDGVIKDRIVQDHTALLQNYFNLPLKYDGIHHKANEEILERVKLAFGKFTYKGNSHFVIINRNKKVTFDSFGKSSAVTYGTLESTRWYYEI